jgi:hypothetical protein
MKRSLATIIALTFVACLWTQSAHAEDQSPKTVTGKSACATCEGVTHSGHNIMLIAKDGVRWVLIGSSSSYKSAASVRKEGKTMTATLDGEPVTKKDDDGKEYKEVKVSDVKIDA